MKNKQPKVLLMDVETSPNLGTYFELYKEGNIVWNEKNWYILSFAWKWADEKKTHVLSLLDFPTFYKKDKEDDMPLVNALWKLFDEADVVIGHNSTAFDVKKTNARFIAHNMQPPSPYKQVDTKLVAKRYFKFDSNKLNDLGKYLGLGEKLQTGGFDLWKRCMAGDKKAWKKMCEYNKQDVVLLEKVYLKLRPWMGNHPNLNILTGKLGNCPNCNSDRIHRRGYGIRLKSKYQRLQCLNCGAWFQGETIKV